MIPMPTYSIVVVVVVVVHLHSIVYITVVVNRQYVFSFHKVILYEQRELYIGFQKSIKK